MQAMAGEIWSLGPFNFFFVELTDMHEHATVPEHKVYVHNTLTNQLSIIIVWDLLRLACCGLEKWRPRFYHQIHKSTLNMEGDMGIGGHLQNKTKKNRLSGGNKSPITHPTAPVFMFLMDYSSLLKKQQQRGVQVTIM